MLNKFTAHNKKGCIHLYREKTKYTGNITYQKLQECLDDEKCNCVYVYESGTTIGKSLQYIQFGKYKEVSNYPGNDEVSFVAFIKK